MAQPLFDKEGNLTNLDELTAHEVAEAYQEKNRDIFGRLTEAQAKAKQIEADKAKIEADLAAERNKPKPEVEVKPGPQSDPEELRLMARGLSDELIEEAKSIAKGKGISLQEALKTKAFILIKENLEEEERKERAKLGASNGSNPSDEAPLVTPNMSREDHMAAFKKRLGR